MSAQLHVVFALFATWAVGCSGGDTTDDSPPDRTPLDADQDGVPARSDCDDEDPSVGQAEPEICNEVDDDCDGLVDDEDPDLVDGPCVEIDETGLDTGFDSGTDTGTDTDTDTEPEPEPACASPGETVPSPVLCSEDCWCAEAPLPGPARLSRIWGSADETIWLTGDSGEIFGWDGSALWAWFYERFGSIEEIHGAGDQVWAVGSQGIYHFDGTDWDLVPESLAGDYGFADVVAVDTDDVWVVGSDWGDPVVVHWDGSSWETVAQDALVDGSVLVAEDATWVVGGSRGSSRLDSPGVPPSSVETAQFSAWSLAASGSSLARVAPEPSGPTGQGSSSAYSTVSIRLPLWLCSSSRSPLLESRPSYGPRASANPVSASSSAGSAATTR